MTERTLNRTQEKAQKKKRTILIVLVSLTAMFWGKALFGGSSKNSAAERAASQGASAANGAPVSAGPSAATVTGSRRGQITLYEQAAERMRSWPDALAREVIAGPIQELTPFNSDTPLPEPSRDTPQHEVDWNTGPVAFDGLGLRLSSTMLLTNDSWAVINGRKVREGEILNLQVSGVGVRYVVEAIKPREVHLRDGEDVHVLRITVGSNPE